jgi:hypothetical protein
MICLDIIVTSGKSNDIWQAFWFARGHTCGPDMMPL